MNDLLYEAAFVVASWLVTEAKSDKRVKASYMWLALNVSGEDLDRLVSALDVLVAADDETRVRFFDLVNQFKEAIAADKLEAAVDEEGNLLMDHVRALLERKNK